MAFEDTRVEAVDRNEAGASKDISGWRLQPSKDLLYLKLFLQFRSTRTRKSTFLSCEYSRDKMVSTILTSCRSKARH